MEPKTEAPQAESTVSMTYQDINERLAAESRAALADDAKYQSESFALALTEIERLRAALKPFAEAARSFAPYPEDMNALRTEVTFTLAQLRAAFDAAEQLSDTGRYMTPEETAASKSRIRK